MAKLKDTIIKSEGSSTPLVVQNVAGDTLVTINGEGHINFGSSTANIGIGNLTNPFIVPPDNNSTGTIVLDSEYENLLNILRDGARGSTVKLALPRTDKVGIQYTLDLKGANTQYVWTATLSVGTSSAASREIGNITMTGSGAWQEIYQFNLESTSETHLWFTIGMRESGFTPSAAAYPTLSYVVPSLNPITNSIVIGNSAVSRCANSISIGSNSGISSPDDEATTTIGCRGGDYKITLGAGGENLVYNNGTASWNSPSDYRDKTSFQDITKGLEFINKLKPVSFVYNRRENYCEEKFNIKTFNAEEHEKATLKGERRHAGFIAQEVYETMKEVYNDDNYADIVDYNFYDGEIENEFERYYIQIGAIIPFLVKANQELTEKVLELEQEINNLKQ